MPDRDSPPAVLVTGSSTGIGRACVLELDRRGYRVFAGVRSPDDGQRLQAEASPRLRPLRLDVTDAAAIAEAAALLRGELGQRGLAGLVNNAGIAVTGPLEILPLDKLRRQFEVNVVGQLAVIQAVLPLLRTARGRIVNIGSLNGALSPPYLGPYAASKHALEALSDSLRMELRRWGILVCLVEPGPIQTPIWDKSRAMADTLAGEVAPEGLQLYAEELEVVRRSVERIAETALPVETVVRAVIHALTAPRPRVRYFGTWSTRLAFKGMKVLPERLRDWIVRRAMGLP
jgi:NAD(P)-dependent dehydrogenase (short-subunit alcohol dehydrogenase family)